MSKELLDLRKKINKKRPAFKQTDHHKKARLDSNTWKRPKGMHNKIRHEFDGKPAKVKPGYRGPKAVRGMHKSGLNPILVHGLSDLKTLDPKTQGAILARVGGKNKLAILTTCKEKGINVLNVGNVDEAIKKITDTIEQRKKTKTETAKQKQEKKAKIKPQKPEQEGKQDPEDVKKDEQEEMERIVRSG